MNGYFFNDTQRVVIQRLYYIVELLRAITKILRLFSLNVWNSDTENAYLTLKRV